MRWISVRRPTGYASGIAVAVDSQYAAPAVLERVAEAVELVERAEPRRLARLRRDVPRLFVGPVTYATHWRRPRAIVLRAQDVLEQPAIWTASVLVHEGTHVRIRQAGHRTTSENRARIERRCVHEQIVFLHRLAAVAPELAGTADVYIAHSQAALAAEIPWYEPVAKWRAILEAHVTEDTPAWAFWIADRLRPTRVGKLPKDGA